MISSFHSSLSTWRTYYVSRFFVFSPFSVSYVISLHYLTIQSKICKIQTTHQLKRHSTPYVYHSLIYSILELTVMVAQWDSSLSVLPAARVIPSHGGVFQGIFPWLITLCQPVLSQRGKEWLNLPPMTPHNLWTARRKIEI